MVAKELKSLCITGVDFFAFLEGSNRESITDRFELKRIYNTEFRRKQEAKKQNFGSVLFALKKLKKIKIQGDDVYFNFRMAIPYPDQWHSHRRRQSEPVQSAGAASPLKVQTSMSGDDEEQGVRKRAQFIADKKGICITSDPKSENGTLYLRVDECEKQYEANLKVKNTGTKDVYFTDIQLFSSQCFTVEDKSNVKTNPLCLQPGDSYDIQVKFCCSLVGFYPATLAFEFKPDLQKSTVFHIVRFLEAQCITALGRELAPVAPYKPPPPPTWTPEVDYRVIDRQRPEGLYAMQRTNGVQLKTYPMPENMTEFIMSLKQCSFVSDKRRTLLESPLSWENYSAMYHLLLYLEEQQMEVDIKRYNIPNNEREEAIMTRDPSNKKLLVLELPGVSENRPSVLQGDVVLVSRVGETKVKYRGYVHSVELACVKLDFGSKSLSRFLDSMKFNVEFTVNRLTLRLQHRAAELAVKYKFGEVLFPAAPTRSSLQTKLPKLSLFDPKLKDNPQQYQAVQHIVAGLSKPAPYLVFGPPGTGKTVTMVEAIKQIMRSQASSHILACAYTNSATDQLCNNILEDVDKHEVFRMYAKSKDPANVPEQLQACCNLKGKDWVFPPKEKLMKYRIIVTTLFTAGRLVTGNIPEGHFTHVFVDEAGYAVETECLIPLAGLLRAKSGQVVLAGDPKQLGPIVKSKFGQIYGMGVSLLERMMNSPMYQEKNNRCVTKLLRNYRSHPDILKIPNKLFYNDELQFFADENVRNSYCKWKPLPKEDFPVIFHGVNGVDKREASSPSFFNVAEVEVLMDYVKKLFQADGETDQPTISPSDIGIVTPYRQQVKKIRQALNKVQSSKDLRRVDLNSLKVGTVEEFQGQERTVILVSTVRSSPSYMKFDEQFNLGFVKNEKRFNVAVTRAKALLVVVGNPRVLSTDTAWSEFIHYCKTKGGYTGYQAEEDEFMMKRLASLCTDIETEESDV